MNEEARQHNSDRGLIYLASPYSDPDPEVQRKRFEAVCRKASDLITRGFLVFSPIAHCRPIAEAGGLPHDFAFWAQHNTALIGKCSEFWILAVDGWRESRGVQSELSLAQAAGLRIQYVSPEIDSPAIPFVLFSHGLLAYAAAVEEALTALRAVCASEDEYRVRHDRAEQDALAGYDDVIGALRRQRDFAARGVPWLDA